MIDLDILNGPQREAVLHTEGPILVLAGAGSGKTRVLTHRTAFLIDEVGVNPWNILAITFTNKAAREMRERIDNLVDYGAENVTVSTFHSLCLKILFRHADKLGWDTNFEICDATDQKSVIKDVCKRLQIDTKSFKERTLLNAISSAKDELINTVDYRTMAQGDFRKEVTARVYDEYQKTLKKNNSFDFDDLIMKTVELFRTHPDVLEYYQERFKYIMVDEYQDTNTAQFELIHLLSMKYRNLCVVGDDDQSIYRFRGANIHNILDFEHTYPEAVVIRLEQNYRSSGNILEAANEVIANNRGRKVKRLWTEAEEGDKILFRQLDTAASEAMFVAEDIKKRVENDGIKFGDCAILMRTNIQSKELEDAFRLLRIDYELVKGLKFWDTKVVKDLTSYLLTVASGVNDMRTNRIINVPKRGIGNASVDKVMGYAVMRGIPLVEACELADDIPGLGKSGEKIKNFAYMIYRLRSKMETMSFAELLDEIIAETEYREYMDKEAETPEKFQEMLDYIDKLKEALTVYEESTEHPDIVDFMRQNGVEGSNISSSIDGGEIDGALTEEEERELREKRVLIMTMHNAKGLEFPYVYLVGMEDGLFPSYMTITGDDPEEMEEERRLCYVALTRAKKHLTITSARQRMVNGETRFSKTSRFVKEIPFGLLDMNALEPKIKESQMPAKPKFTPSLVQPRFTPSPTQPRFTPSPTQPKFTPSPVKGYGSLDSRPTGLGKRVAAIKKGSQMAVPEAPDYGPGDRVRHVKFGEGLVESVAKGSKDYEVVVNFDEYGVKRMFAGFAKLVKI